MNQEIIAANLAAVQVHFDAEKAGDWEKIKTMYTEDIIWDAHPHQPNCQGQRSGCSRVCGGIFCP